LHLCHASATARGQPFNAQLRSTCSYSSRSRSPSLENYGTPQNRSARQRQQFILAPPIAWSREVHIRGPAVTRVAGHSNALRDNTEMKVKRIVTDIAAADPSAAKRFYQDVLGLEPLMDLGWIATYGSREKMTVQISFASEGGSGAPTPELSIEVDDVDTALTRMKKAGFAIEYGPADEPWGVRRFFVRDPFGKLVNVLSHK
jgi:catechol 2,3-dioxygenase-like lactoylglutathione lyase family enzyme